MKRLSICLILVFMVIIFTGSNLLASQHEANTEDIGIQALTNQEVWFMDKNKNRISSYVRDSNYLYIRGEQNYISTVLADGRMELLIDAKFAAPVIVSTNLPQNSFVYGNNSKFGGYCYRYDSGVFWYWPSATKYMEVRTSTSYPGSHKAMIGMTASLIANPWATSYLNVQ